MFVFALMKDGLSETFTQSGTLRYTWDQACNADRPQMQAFVGIIPLMNMHK